MSKAKRKNNQWRKWIYVYRDHSRNDTPIFTPAQRRRIKHKEEH